MTFRWARQQTSPPNGSEALQVLLVMQKGLLGGFAGTGLWLKGVA